jgi:integrase
MGLLRDGHLVPDRSKVRVPLFREFAMDFWDWEKSEYLKLKRARRPIRESYANSAASAVKRFLIPAFGTKRLDLINELDVDSWLTSLTADGYTVNTANVALGIFNTMMKFALRKKLITTNPCDGVKCLEDSGKRKMQILTVDEVRQLFPSDWTSIWQNEIAYLFNKLAACTGMRHGELLGLKGQYLEGNKISVCGQYYGKRYVDSTKTHKPRVVPVPEVLMDELQMLREQNNLGDGYIFSMDGGVTPVSRNITASHFKAALNRIGINGAEQKRRRLCIHSWRHFLNTLLLSRDVNVQKTQEVTGHTSEAMTNHYKHFEGMEFPEVRNVQNDLFKPAATVCIEQKPETPAALRA